MRTALLPFLLLLIHPFTAFSAGFDLAPDESYRAKRAPELRALEEYVFPAAPPPGHFVSDGLLLVKGGRIIYERYANGFSPDRRHAGWSMSKSAVGAVLGAAIADGKIALTDSICKYVHVPDEKSYCGITVRHLVNHSSGLDWSEAYEDSDEPKDSAVISMLYGEGIQDVEKFVLNLHKPRYEPGTRWNYSSGDSNLLVAILQKAIKTPEWDAYPWKRIFDPIGATGFRWERDARGVFIGSSYLHGTARDYARLGLLFLRGGNWNGKQILPRAWVEFSTLPAPALAITKPVPNASTPEEPESYGAHWWLNRANPKFGIGQPWPSNPENVSAMLGHWGQSTILVPDEDLVVVRFGTDKEKRISTDTLLKLAREFAK